MHTFRTAILLFLCFTTPKLLSFNKLPEQCPPWEEHIQLRLDSLMQSDSFAQNAHIGMVVTNLANGHALYEKDSGKAFTPASNMKLLVAAAALHHCDTSMMFSTSLWFSGTIRRKSLRGDLFLRGGGDPEFSSTHLALLLDTISRNRIKKIRGGVRADTSLIATLPWGRGWSWDDIPYSFLPRLSALIINKGRMNTPSDTLRWLRLGDNDRSLSKSPEYSLALFQEEVEQLGIVIAERNPRFQRTPLNAHLLAEHRSSFREVLIPMLKESDNLNAEMMLLALGHSGSGFPATTDKGLMRLDTLLQEWGFKPASYRLADGSGLSFYNALSPAQMMRTLQELYHSPYFPLIKEALPIAGVDGTLKNRMKGGCAEGVVYAKTGTLTGVSCLSGYVLRPDGLKMAFTLLIRGFAGPAASALAFQDAVVEVLSAP